MANGGLGRALDHLRRALPLPAGEDLTDEQLLKRFLAGRDELAFAALVRRHGSMVLGVCRRVLGNVHDSEDAFQATFLILAQKARTVIHSQAVGGWLHTVACRIALDIRSANARRRKRERQVTELPHPLVSLAQPKDWLPLFDRELSRLPQKYLTAIVLCELEGRTRKEAARQLRLPEGTLSSRLATAKRMLAKRLARCGLAISAAGLTAEFSEAGASVHVPVPLIWSTAHAATLVAAGQLAALSTPAAVLTKGALKAMFLAKLKTTSAAIAVTAMVGLGSLVYSAGAGTSPAQAQAKGEAGQVSELDALRKENQLLNINLRVTLEKIRALESELDSLKQTALTNAMKAADADAAKDLAVTAGSVKHREAADLKKVLDARRYYLNGIQAKTSGASDARPTVANVLLKSWGSASTAAHGETASTATAPAAARPNAASMTATKEAKPDMLITTTAPVHTATISAELFSVEQLKWNEVAAEIEAALKVLRTADSKGDRQQALEALDRATKKLKEQIK